MRGLSILAASVALAVQAHAAEQVPIHDSSYRDGYGHRVQQLSVVVDATVAKVWDAFMTDDGFTRWATPVAHITVENGGGMMESSYLLGAKIGDPDNIKNEIVAYLPNSMIAIHNVQMPKGAPFDPMLIGNIRTVITFDDLGGKTRVTESQVGYGDGAGYDSMYTHFRDGNAAELESLAQSFLGNPVDWKAEAAKMQASVHKPAK
jgi:uncharacterized protein YndB with AHSA1/START domain